VNRSYGFRIRNKRPCLFLIIPFIVGIIAAKYLQPRFILWQYFLLGGLRIIKKRIIFHSRRVVSLFIVALAFLMGVLVASAALARDNAQARLSRLLGKATDYTYTAVLIEDPFVIGPAYGEELKSAHYARVKAIIETVELEGKERSFGVRADLRITVDDNSVFQYGDRVRCSGSLEVPTPLRNPGSFDYADWLRQQGIHITALVDSPDEIILVKHNCGSLLRRGLWALRRSLRRGLLAGRMNNSSRAFLLGMTVGDKGLVSPELREALINTNSMHILVISGLHIGIFAYTMLLLLRLIPMRRTWRLLVVVLLLFVYAALLDFRPPAFRAAIMISAFLVSPLFRREADLANTLAFAAFIILVIRPLDLFTASFQLSVLIVFSLILLAGPLTHWIVDKLCLAPDRGFLIVGPLKRKLLFLMRHLVGLATASFVAFIGGAPLVAYYFHLINPLSILSNAIVILFVGVSVSLGLLSAIAGICSTVLAAGLNFLNGFIISRMISLIDLFSQASFSIFYLKAPSILHIFGCYLLIGLVGFSSSFSLRVRAILIVLLTITLILVPLSSVISGDKNTHVTVLDLDENDAQIIEIADEENVLISNRLQSEKQSRWTIHPFLKSRGINSIDTIILTALDEYRYSGLEYILNRYRVKRIVLPLESDNDSGIGLVEMIRHRSIDVIQVDLEKSYRIRSDPDMIVHGVASSRSAGDNNTPGLLVSLEDQKNAVLFCIGVHTDCQKALVENSSGTEKLILISDSRLFLSSELDRQNRYSPEHLLVVSGDVSISGQSEVLSTGRHGAIKIDLLDNDFEIQTMLPYNR